MKSKDFLDEKWSEKYKKSINCANPKGFSQRAHCAGRKKNESADAGISKDKETEFHAKLDKLVHNTFGKRKDEMKEGSGERCMQCGMKNCTCPGDSCKCKPIAGWIPGKGFAKAKQGVAEGVTSPEIKQAYDDIMKTAPKSPERRAAIKKYQALRADALKNKKQGVAEGFSDSRLVNLPGGNRDRELPSERPWTADEKKKRYDDWIKSTQEKNKGTGGCPRCHSTDIKTYSDGEKECHQCHKTWDIKGVAEGLFGIDPAIKGKIQNITMDLSDIPGYWDHKQQTFTDMGLAKLKAVLKKPEYVKYALNLTSDDYDADLREADAELAEPPERPRKTTTKTKTKPDIKFNIPFQQDQDRPLAKADPLDDLKRNAGMGGDKSKVDIRKASQKTTLDKTSGLGTPEMGDMLSRLRNIEVDPTLEPYEIEQPEDLPSVDVNTKNLPAVAGQALQAAGQQNPEFHQVANLPGNMADQIRQLGKSLFGSLTMTPTKRIYVVANLGGQGPNTNQEVQAVAGFLKEHGKDLGPGDVDFDAVMPGYKAQTHMFSAAGIRWMLVKDFAGQYIYCWPEADSHDAVDSIGHDQDVKRLK